MQKYRDALPVPSMVVFTCNACGESLKKKDVEKHYYTKCRSCNMVTCIDCNKDFWGDTYKEHIKCLTEAERYGGKDFKAPVFKGEAKQQEWIDLLSNITSTHDVNPRVREVFQRIQAFNNIPRKEKPFKNFLGSSMGVRNAGLVEEVWKTIQEAVRSAQKPQPGKQQPAQQGQAKPKDSAGDKKLQNNGASEESTGVKELQAGSSKDSASRQGTESKKGEQLNSANQDVVEDGETQQPEKQLQNGTKRLQATPAKEAQAEKLKKQMKNGTPAQKGTPKKKLVQSDAPNETATESKQAQQRPKKHESDGAGSQVPAKKKKRSQDDGVGQGTAPEQGQAAKKPKLQEENKDGEAEEAEEEQEPVKKKKFKWKKAIKVALLEADNCQLSAKLLKKRVFNEFRNQGGLLSEEDMQAKFDKVLSNQRYFEQEGGNVRCVHLKS